MKKGGFSDSDLKAMSPKTFRSIVKQGKFIGSTEACCQNYVQANLVIVHRDLAYDFILFATRNPKACPIIDVTDIGDPCPKLLAPSADLRTDIPQYHVYENGKLVDRPMDISSYWANDLVAFLIGCSNTFDWALQAANIKYRYVGAYRSNIECVPAGCIHGHMAVSARFFEGTYNAIRAIQVTSRYSIAHGAPVHIGDPSIIGIKDIYSPDSSFSEIIAPQEPGEIAMYWGCGMTPQVAALESSIPFMITHRPDYLFVTDWLCEELVVL